MKNQHSLRSDSKLQDSPYSDYFTDDGRENGDEDATYHAPSAETQQLLVRMNKLQAQLMRGDEDVSEHDMLHVFGRKIDELEVQLGTLHSQTRQPPDLDDSGLFMEDEESSEEQESQAETPNETNFMSHHKESKNELLNGLRIATEDDQESQDRLLDEAQKVFANVAKLEKQIFEHRAEMKEMKLNHTTQNEDYEQQIAILKDENEALKSDLGFDQTELLFLKLQHKALEVQVETFHEAARRLETYAPEIVEDIQQARRNKIYEEMRRWELEWERVNKRHRDRRVKHGLPVTEMAENGLLESAIGENSDELGDWKLETVKKGESGVESITITRSSPRDLASNEAGGDHGEEQDAPTPIQLWDLGAQLSSMTDSGPKAHAGMGTQQMAYIDQSTQTELSALESWLLVDTYQVEDAGSQADGEDCAITTSSEDNNDDDRDMSSSTIPSGDNRKEEGAVKSSVRAAWQDLWKGLADLAGMSEERF